MEEDSLNPPEESAEDLYENAPFGYISFLGDGTIFKVNKTLLDQLQYEKEEIVQLKKIQSLFRIGGKIYFETHFFPLVRMQGFVKEINFDLVRKDGSFFPALLNVNQIAGSNTNNSFFRASVIDITDRKKYEKVLLESKERAEKASRAKAEFLSTISHEIRTPLNAIVGIGNLIHKTDLNDLQKQYARILQLSSQSLLELVNNLLDLSKLEAQKVKMEERVFSLNDLLKVLILSFEIKAAEKNIQLLTDFPEDLPEFLIGDPVKLNQVLTNLLGNAVKFTNEGFVKLKIAGRKSEKTRTVLEFTVLDTGIGIPKDKFNTILQEFSQASYDVNLEYGGTGLGLTITQKLLQMFGSELVVKSEEGKGSEFSFELAFNLPKRPPSKKKQSNLAEQSGRPGGKILVVDDNPTNLFITSQYLEGWNLEYKTVDSGPAAIEVVEQEYFDIILMDLHMPKMDGYETSTRIRTLGLSRQPVIIALSASGRGDVNLKMKRAGIKAYLPKPFDPQDLQDVITQFLNYEEKESPRELPLQEKSPAQVPEKKAATAQDRISKAFPYLAELSQKDPDILKKLIENFLRSMKLYQKEFTSAANQQNAKKLDELLHKNTTTLHYLQAEKLSELTKRYREDLKGLQTGKADQKEVKNQILNEFKKIISELESLKSEDLS